MESTQFYRHLSSNRSLDKFPNNTLTEYRVGLPQTVSLRGDWEVALQKSIIRTVGIISKEILAIDVPSEARIIRSMGGTNYSTGGLFFH